MRWALIALGMLFLGLLVVTAARRRLREAFAKGLGASSGAITEPDALSAIKLTLLVAAIVGAAEPGVRPRRGLAHRASFGSAARALLTTLIDLPFAVSPVISGLIFVLLFGRAGLFGPWLRDHDIKIIFAVPGHRAGHDVRDLPASSRAS